LCPGSASDAHCPRDVPDAAEREHHGAEVVDQVGFEALGRDLSSSPHEQAVILGRDDLEAQFAGVLETQRWLSSKVVEPGTQRELPADETVLDVAATAVLARQIVCPRTARRTEQRCGQQ
jgi:hypothetical protein